jgi:ABC-type Fe3+-hydroxamate transport system substrate-binding protein
LQPPEARVALPSPLLARDIPFLRARARRPFAKAVLCVALALRVAALPGDSAIGASAVSVTDGAGRRIELRAPARRIISLSPGATEILVAIGAGDLVVGRGEDCDFPDPALGAPVVPSSRDGEAKALAGMEDEGIRAAARLTLSVSRVRAIFERIPSSRYPRVFWEASAVPLASCGANSFAHGLLSAAGGKGIFPASGDDSVAAPRLGQAREILLRHADEFAGILG